MLSPAVPLAYQGMDAVEEIAYHDHVCLLSNGPEDNRDLLIQFFRRGLDNGAMCVYVSRDKDAQRLFSYMRSVGFEVDHLMESGRFMHVPREGVVIQEGRFNPDSLLNAWEEVVRTAVDKGFTGVYGVGEMSWSVGDESGLDRFMEFESRYNDICPRNFVIGLCNYDVTRFKPEILAGAMRTHPKVIIDGVLCRNPYYVPSKEFTGPNPVEEFDRLSSNILSFERYHRQLEEMNGRLSREMRQKVEAESSLNAVNRKLEILGRITRHDMMNQLMILEGYIHLCAPKMTDPVAGVMMRKAEDACHHMVRHLNFSRDYMDVGARSPIWTSAEESFTRGAATVDRGDRIMEVKLDGLKLYADPMLEKVFHNLVDNSVRHGKKVTNIEVDWRKEGSEVIISYRDNGVGLDHDTRAKLLSGRCTHGMYLANEILHITGMELREVGEESTGARFEIRVPEGTYRIRA